ncbi:MAG TPA: FecR domain-containing protein [Pyrinomonadaceae bacterium]|nr:FecR domain-containing protein [Pyrinomonadaceae bacterium]
MFSNHISDLSSAYLHNELTPEQTRQVAEHMMGCARCRAAFAEVKLGIRFAEQLESISAPASLWPRIAAGLNVDSAPSWRFQFLKPVAIAAAILLVAGAGFFLLRRPHVEQISGWRVARLVGAPRIGSESINDQGRLRIGQWLETDSSSRAKLDVANIGNVEIDPNTRVRLLQSNNSEHRLELERGRLRALISAPPKLFFVNTPSGVAEDLGCAYTLEVDDDGNSHLRVTLGWVALQLRDRESVVPAGAACVTRPGIGPGTPYFEDSSESFRASLSQFDFPADQSSQRSALEIILREARPRDAMTLFYLLSPVQGNERARVYDRLAALVAPPDGVTRDGMLNLNPQMMGLWKSKLGLTWGLALDQAVKTLKTASTSGAGKPNGPQGKR